jgi:hypothetical protein
METHIKDYIFWVEDNHGFDALIENYTNNILKMFLTWLRDNNLYVIDGHIISSK